MIPTQPDLFGTPGPIYPPGFQYAEAIVPASVQQSLLAEVSALPFKAFDFHGFEGKRRVVSFGWRYDFDTERLAPSEPMPGFLLQVRGLAAQFAGLEDERLQQALVTEYGPGAPIGWHKDKGVFGAIVGISLLSACTFRLRRKMGTKWERVSLEVQPGSAYLLSGAARQDWEHSIPPVEQTRYSITFREIR